MSNSKQSRSASVVELEDAEDHAVRSKSKRSNSARATDSAVTYGSVSNSQQAHLIAIGDSTMTEIFIINSQFERVAKGVGRVEVDLSAGLYKVKFKAGTLIHEVLIDLPPGPQPFEIRAPQLRFSSSAPIAGTLTTHEYHQGPAHSLSHEILLRRGNGSQLLVYLRDLERPSRANPAAGLTLRDADGKLVVDLHIEVMRRAITERIPTICASAEIIPAG
jgi:hypothetical protein